MQGVSLVKPEEKELDSFKPFLVKIAVLRTAIRID